MEPGKRLGLDYRELQAFCIKHHIRKLSLFGSVAAGIDGPNSDMDVLVEFEAGFRVGLIHLAGIERELSAMVGRKVDMRTPGELSRYFREDVLRSAQVQYARG
jgi:uncharacterized protein